MTVAQMIREGNGDNLALIAAAFERVPLLDAALYHEAFNGGGMRVFPSLIEVSEEMHRQEEKWGKNRHHPSAWGPSELHLGEDAEYFKQIVDRASQNGGNCWADILIEELAEALDDFDDPALCLKEVIQVAAVAASWADDLLREGAR